MRRAWRAAARGGVDEVAVEDGGGAGGRTAAAVHADAETRRKKRDRPLRRSI